MLTAIFEMVEGALWGLYRERTSSVGRRLDAVLAALHRKITQRERGNVGPTPPRPSRETLNRLGLTVWLVPGWYQAFADSPFWQRILKRPKQWFGAPRAQLWQASQLRYVGDVDPSEIAWTRSTGALGVVWDTRRPKALDMAAQWPQVDPGSPEWVTAWAAITDPAVRMNLTAEEAARLRENYSAVHVVPIFHRKRGSTHALFLGCLALDAPDGVTDIDILSTQMRDQLKQAARGIARSLRGAES